MLRHCPAHQGFRHSPKAIGLIWNIFQLGGCSFGPKELPPQGFLGCCWRWWRGINLWLSGAVTSQGRLQAGFSHWLLIMYGWANLGVSAHGQIAHFFQRKQHVRFYRTSILEMYCPLSLLGSFKSSSPFLKEWTQRDSWFKCNHCSLKYLLDLCCPIEI